jgi:hypothetical protein
MQVLGPGLKPRPHQSADGALRRSMPARSAMLVADHRDTTSTL